jgi:hypothetical protein
VITQDGAEVVVGHGIVGLEPDRLAVRGDRLGQLASSSQGEGEVEVNLGIVGPSVDASSADGDRPIQHGVGLGRPASLLQELTQAGEVPTSLGPSGGEVTKGRLGLLEPPQAFQHVCQVVSGLRA